MDKNSGNLSAAFTHMRTVSAFSMQRKVGQEYFRDTQEISEKRKKRSGYDGLALGMTLA